MSELHEKRVGVGRSSPEEREAALQEWCDDVVRLVNGGLEFPDIHPTGRLMRGNMSGRLVEATFESSGAEVFVAHDLGYTVDRWTVVAPDEPAVFCRGTTEDNATGVYVRAFTLYDGSGVAVTTWPVTTRLMLFGRRPDARVRRIVS